MRRQRTTVAQHGRLPSPNALRRVVVYLLAAVCSVALAAAGVGAYLVTSVTSSVRNNSVDLQLQTPPAPPSLSAYPGAFTMMVIGTDECDERVVDVVGAGRCYDPDSPGHLNDVNILIHVSDAPRRVTVMSFPRDLRVDIADCTDDQGVLHSGSSKINTAYGYGGSQGLRCAADTLSELTGMQIDFAAKLSFADVVTITDAVGGVTVCVAGEGIHDPEYTGLSLDPGEHTISGGEALQFLRVRHGLSQGSDLSRISNQQQYMSRLLQRLKSEAVLSNPVTLLKLANVVATNVQTDSNLADPVRMAQLAFTLKDIALDEMTFVSWPVYDAGDGTYDVITISNEAETLLDAVKNNVPLQLSQTGAGTVVADGADPSTEGTTEPPAEVAPVEGTDPAAEPSPSATVVESNASGQTAAQQTCSNGVFG